MNKLKLQLQEFKLSSMVNSVEDRVSYTNTHSLSYTKFLEMLCEDEEKNRISNSDKKKYSKAKLPAHKTIEEFDFNFQQSIDKKQINDATTCNQIEEKRNIIFIVNPGTGKNHLTVALGVKALQKNYKVLFTSMAEMLYQLHISKADNSYYKKLNDYISPDLLILDKLWFKKLPQYSVNDFLK